MSESQKSKSQFPNDFFWGASTAAHQVDGGTVNDWTVWELATAAERARLAGSQLVVGSLSTRQDQLPLWAEIKDHVEDPDNYVSGPGIEHYTRYEQDFDTAKELNFNAFRFGIEWSRIESEEGVWDQQAIEHYRQYISELKQRGLEPFLNVWHWTNPLWFTEKGGFTKRANLKYFNRYVHKIAEEFAGEVNFVLTINEPNNYVLFGYVLGTWPPQQKNILNAIRVYWHLCEAHRQAYRAFKSANPQIQIGAATQMTTNLSAKGRHPIGWLTARLSNYFWNWFFYDRTKKYHDFIGFNHYFTLYYKRFMVENPPQPISDVGWYMEPFRIYDLLMWVAMRYKKPIYITENGVADMHDTYRQWWIEQTIAAMERAVRDGADVRGYFHWSLLDNFEWSYGWWPKFGLVSVDREHGMKRTIRPSARWFAKKISELQK